MSTPAGSKKDVIYIDIEDDITSVIEKVKGASAPIVALVPPKRIGVLQSIVNLKLLQRAATGAKKRVVLITGNQALTGLAAGLAIPVAKNLQSRPEVPAATTQAVADEEVINGDELPVGELAKTADEPIEIDGLDLDETPSAAPAAAVTAPFATKAAARAPKKSTIPDFDKFRKKLFLGIGGGILLVAFLVWALFFAARATVSITAQTNVVNINKVLQLRSNATLDPAQAVTPFTSKQVKKTASVDFTPTGQKDVGEKATGSVKFSNEGGDPASIPAGTQVVSASGLPFVTNAAVTVPAATLTFGNECGADHLCEGTSTIGVTAAGRGTKYNGASGAVSGSFDGASGAFTDATAGGTDKTATVVSQSDIDKAKDKLTAQDSNQVKTELKKQFSADMVVINESFTIDPGQPTSAPAVDQEASAAKLTSETTYTLLGVKHTDLKAIFDTYTKSQIANAANQKIYASGDDKASFTEFNKGDSGYSVRVQAGAQVGPNIDEKALAQQLTKKRSGEIQQQVEAIQGVEDVSVKFSPFWVTKAPGKADRITIKFVIKND